LRADDLRAARGGGQVEILYMRWPLVNILRPPQGLELTCQRLDVLHVTYPNAPSVQDEEEGEDPLLAVDYQVALGALTLSYEDPEDERIDV
jgi:hypothetical protein